MIVQPAAWYVRNQHPAATRRDGEIAWAESDTRRVVNIEKLACLLVHAVDDDGVVTCVARLSVAAVDKLAIW